MNLSQRVMSCLNEASDKSCDDKIAGLLKSKVGMNDKEVRYFLGGGSGYEPELKSAQAKVDKYFPKYDEGDTEPFWKELGVTMDEVDGMLRYRGLID